jgi:hypothetical protein
MSSVVVLSVAQTTNVLSAIANNFLDKNLIDASTVGKPTLAAMVAKAKPLTAGAASKVMTRLTPPSKGEYTSHYQTINHQRTSDPQYATFGFCELVKSVEISETELKEFGWVVTDNNQTSAMSNESKAKAADIAEAKLSPHIGDAVTGMEDFLAEMLMRDGSQSLKAAPGLDAFISLNPAVGTIGGINRANFAAWRNYAQPNIANPTTTDNIDTAMRTALRFVTTTARGKAPDLVTCGEDFYEAASARARSRNTMNSDMGQSSDYQFLNGKLMVGKTELVWDPYFAMLDAAQPGLANPWKKRCYLINTDDIYFEYLNVSKSSGLSDSTKASKKDLFAVRNPIRASNEFVFRQQLQFTGNLVARALNTSAVLSIA